MPTTSLTVAACLVTGATSGGGGSSLKAPLPPRAPCRRTPRPPPPWLARGPRRPRSPPMSTLQASPSVPCAHGARRPSATRHVRCFAARDRSARDESLKTSDRYERSEVEQERRV